ncbi:MAG: hypothetical protein HDT01_04985 [Bacteroidales bacterium]|nr:hypothetical protein [Bacteroidales bacterium]
MKKIYSWMTVMAAVLSLGFTSCSDNDEPKKEESAAPELLSFSFNVAENSEVLSADCVGVISDADKTVKVTMPAFADKSSLIATFTVAEGNTVLVNGITQESGKTANDFNAPVDYIISNTKGDKNIKYTVTIEKSADYVWSEVARYTEVVPRGSNAVMKLNITDNVPYIGFVSKASNKMVVVKNENGNFSYVGGNEVESTNVASGRFDFTVSNNGTPYFIYGDNDCSSLKAAATVMSFNGSAWSTVGDAGIAGFVPSKLQIGVLGSEVIAPMVVNANKGSFQKREVYSSIYNNGWQTNSMASVGINNAAVECMSTTANAAYLYTISAATYKYSVAMFKDGSWKALRSEYLEEGATQAPILMADAASIVGTNDGVIYLLTADDKETGSVKDMRFRVLKYTPDTEEWTLVGGSTISSIKADDSHISAKLAVAPDGTPFLAYTDYKGDKCAKVQYFDNDTKQWSEPITLSAENASSISIEFCDNGEAYISFVGKDDNIVLMKYAAKK